MSATIGMYNQDESFFTLSSPDLSIDKDVQANDVRQLSVVETMNRMDTGTLELNDPTGMYGRLFRFGLRLDITWGYKAWNQRLQSRFDNPTSFDLFTQGISRTGLRLFCSTPSGEATDGGEQIFRVNLVAMDVRGAQQQRTFSSGTRGSIVTQVMAEIGVSAPIVKFGTMNTAIDDSTAVNQWESDFSFLARLAYEWGAFFRISRDASGTLVGIFVDPGAIQQSSYLKSINGNGPDIYKLEWGAGERNVIAYTWQSHMGESGAGDGSTFAFVNGQVVMYRYVVKNEQVTAWRLNTNRIRQFLIDQGKSGGPSAIASAAKDALNTKDFSSVVGISNGQKRTVRYFFDQVTGNTAPQGYGMTINARMPGTPMIIPSMPIAFGQGFPDRLGRDLPYNPYGNDINFLVRQHTHTISSQGYLSQLEVIDSFTAFTENQSRQ